MPLQPILRVPTSAGFLRIEASQGSDDMIAIMLVPERRSLPPGLPPDWPLTLQEKQLLELLIQGQSTRKMASTLVVSENTVETHLRYIYEKLDVHSRNELLSRFFHKIYGLTSKFFPQTVDVIETLVE